MDTWDSDAEPKATKAEQIGEVMQRILGGSSAQEALSMWDGIQGEALMQGTEAGRILPLRKTASEPSTGQKGLATEPNDVDMIEYALGKSSSMEQLRHNLEDTFVQLSSLDRPDSASIRKIPLGNGDEDYQCAFCGRSLKLRPLAATATEGPSPAWVRDVCTCEKSVEERKVLDTFLRQWMEADAQLKSLHNIAKSETVSAELAKALPIIQKKLGVMHSICATFQESKG